MAVVAAGKGATLSDGNGAVASLVWDQKCGTIGRQRVVTFEVLIYLDVEDRDRIERRRFERCRSQSWFG